MDTSTGEASGTEEVKNMRGRRMRTIAEKRKIVEETLLPGASVARVARAHEANANQVFHWRRLYERGRMGEREAGATSLLAVRITKPSASSRAEPGETGAKILGWIELESSKGRLRVEGSVDTAALRVVVERLLA
jgi:transposase